jgi:hypothetical protein
VWMLRIYDTVVDPDGVVRQYFDTHARLIDDQVYSGASNARVQGFLTQTIQNLPEAAMPLNAALANRVQLLGFESSRARAGEFFDAVLYWQPLQTLNYNYKRSLQVLDASGHVVAQPPDETPLGDALPTSRWRVGEIYREPVRVSLPAHLAPGAYTIIVKLYNPNSLEVLGAPIQLARFEVGR